MAKKKKEQNSEQPQEEKLEAANEQPQEEVKPKEFPQSSDPVDPYLFRWKDRLLSHDETSYIRNTLAQWLYAAKGIDKRAMDLTQQDLEQAMKDGKFAKKVSPWFK